MSHRLKTAAGGGSPERFNIPHNERTRRPIWGLNTNAHRCRACMANFIDIQGEAAGRGGFLIGVSPDNIEYLSSSFSDRLQKTCLNLHLCSGAVVQVQEPEAIERILEELGLSQAEWQLNLENLELLND